MSESKKPDEREQVLRFYLGLLKKEAGWCLNETNKILRCHVRFASLMAQRIDDASKSQYNLKYDDSETTRLAKGINEASRSLSINVSKMVDDLSSFVSALEEVQVTLKKEPSLVERILGWLKHLFNVIARILATVCPPISALLPSAEPKEEKSGHSASILREAAAKFCTVNDSLMQNTRRGKSLRASTL